MTTRKLPILTTALILIVGVWAFWLEPASLRNEDHNINLSVWPSDCNGLRVAVLADLHVGSPFNSLDKLEEIVTLTLAAKPDLVLLAGDYVIHGIIGGKFTAPEEAGRVLARLTASMGVYAVLGNHDWWFDAGRITNALESAGIHVLDDTSIPLQRDKCQLWLVGISDFWEGAHDVKTALRDVPESACIIALTHNPDVFTEIPSRVALTIAGHTHGGQVYIPGIGRPVVPSNYGQRYAVGHIVEDNRHLFVSPGLGTSIFPVRFLVPPEVSILNIQEHSTPGE